MSIMLVAVTITFLLLTLPQYIRHVVFTFVDFRGSAEKIALSSFLYHGSQKLYMTNSCVNFILYSATGTLFHSTNGLILLIALAKMAWIRLQTNWVTYFLGSRFRQDVRKLFSRQTKRIERLNVCCKHRERGDKAGPSVFIGSPLAKNNGAEVQINDGELDDPWRDYGSGGGSESKWRPFK